MRSPLSFARLREPRHRGRPFVPKARGRKLPILFSFALLEAKGVDADLDEATRNHGGGWGCHRRRGGHRRLNPGFEPVVSARTRNGGHRYRVSHCHVLARAPHAQPLLQGGSSRGHRTINVAWRVTRPLGSESLLPGWRTDSEPGRRVPERILGRKNKLDMSSLMWRKGLCSCSEIRVSVTCLFLGPSPRLAGWRVGLSHTR